MKIINSTFLFFKKLKNTNIKFDDVTILIGQNNSGKTTVLEGLITTLSASSEYSNYGYLTKTTPSRESIIRVSVLFDEHDLEEFLDAIGIQKTAEHNKILKQKVTFEWKHTSDENIKNCSFDTNFYSKYRAKLKLDSILNQVKDSIEDYVLHLGVDSFCKTLDKEYLVKMINKLIQQGKFTKLSSDIKKFFDNLELTISSTDNKIKIIQKFFENKIELEVDEMGNGFKRILFMLINVILYKPKIILLDEPDVSIHSDLIKTMILYLKEIGVQLIIATHNEIFLNEFKKQNIRFLRSKSAIASSVIEDEYFSVDDVFNDLGLNIRYKKSLILSSDLVILVEDETDEEYIKKLFKLIKNDLLTTFNIVFEYTHGNKLFDTSVLDRINRSPIPIMIVRDSDEISSDQISAINRKYGDRVHYWKRREIENYALSIASLRKVTKYIDDKTGIAKDLEKIIKEAANKLINKVVIMQIYARYKKLYLVDERQEIHHFIQKYQDQDITEISNKFKNEIIDKFTEQFKNLQDEFESERKKLIDSWTNVKNIFNDCPGKDIITEIKSMTDSQFSNTLLFDSLTEADVDIDIKHFADKITRIITNQQYRYLYEIQLFRSRRGIENLRNINFLNNEVLSPVIINDSIGYISNFRPTDDKELPTERYSYHDTVNKRFICKYLMDSGNYTNLTDLGIDIYIRDTVFCKHNQLELLLATGSYYIKKGSERYPDSFDSLFIIDLASGKMIRRIDLYNGGDDDGKEGDLGSLLYNFGNQTMYVSSIYAEGGKPCLYKIPLKYAIDERISDENILANVNTLKIGRHGPISIAKDDDWKYLYAIDNDEYLYVMDLNTNSIIDRIPLNGRFDRISPSERKQIAVNLKNHNLYVIINGGELLYLDVKGRREVNRNVTSKFLFVISDTFTKNTFAVIREYDEDSDKPYSDVLCILEENLIPTKVAKLSPDIEVVDITCNHHMICVIAKHNEFRNESSAWFFNVP